MTTVNNIHISLDQTRTVTYVTV